MASLPNRLPGLNFDLGEGADMLRSTVEAFSAEEIAPRAAATDRENARLRRQVAVNVRHIKGRQELTCGQVASSTEDDHIQRKIERFWSTYRHGSRTQGKIRHRAARMGRTRVHDAGRTERVTPWNAGA